MTNMREKVWYFEIVDDKNAKPKPAYECCNTKWSIKKKKTELQYSFVFIWQYIIKKLKDVGREDIANDKRRENDEKFHTQDIK